MSAAIISRLGLEPHPEGGWYRETLRVPDPAGGRDLVTAIHFLLEAGQRSHWHRVDATEIWCWHAGAALELGIAEGEGAPVTVRLGGTAARRPALSGPAAADRPARLLARNRDPARSLAGRGCALLKRPRGGIRQGASEEISAPSAFHQRLDMAMLLQFPSSRRVPRPQGIAARPE